ncbi:Sensors of blue-light using FAD [Oceanospirillum multiglobuliferum]|uniref:BLUF domain-containing protein n=1 Tax=Oceanospirillum multiglobuliferum TaxID=64969 RepID=A0A1T4MWJ9_9GAMM|nr:BLUF domain-containing protein [Oceanospirillum multiglobuliferum]OPX56868.1 hypothetical protein BTE48_00065 [Oceanospirillum multiglobuliferum]SJZ71155.1 Sensors of blue-light using FAD [Oceanospirillum multiglobuliferum]
MFLVRLIYTSQVTGEFSKDDIEQIISSAKENNRRAGITGLLCFNRKYFLQVLEGTRTQVNALYHHILQDSRHTQVILLSYHEITQREFDQWHMAYVPEAGLRSEVCQRYSGSKEFNPLLMLGDSCLKLLLELRGAVPQATL